MPSSVMLIVALLACVCGFSWLALAMEPHWRQVHGETASISRSLVLKLRVLGGVALFVSLLLCLQVDHVSMASLVWVMSLAASALIVTFTLSWRPRALGWLVAWARS